jgi:membrane-associated phospholipid phosphatase
MLVMHAWRRRAEIGVVAGLVLGAVIGIARVFDDAHTVSEVFAGWLIGSALAVLFTRRFARANIAPRSPAVAAAGLLLVSSVAYGHHAPFQAMIERYSPGICERFL